MLDSTLMTLLLKGVMPSHSVPDCETSLEPINAEQPDCCEPENNDTEFQVCQSVEPFADYVDSDAGLIEVVEMEPTVLTMAEVAELQTICESFYSDKVDV